MVADLGKSTWNMREADSAENCRSRVVTPGQQDWHSSPGLLYQEDFLCEDPAGFMGFAVETAACFLRDRPLPFSNWMSEALERYNV